MLWSFSQASQGCNHFVNADLIASGLNPLAPNSERIAASRIFLNEINLRIERATDFSYESTLSGKSNLRLIHRLKDKGWTVELVYLALPSIDLCEERVRERVAHGGHDIPTQDIRRRSGRSLSNLLANYASLPTRTRCFMNHLPVPVPVFESSDGKLGIVDDRLYKQLRELATNER